MLPEITDFAGPLTLVVAGLVLAILVTSLTGRLPIPAPALFLAGAAIASDVIPSLSADVGIITVERVAVIALIVILFNGGRDIGAHRLRQSLGDVSAIGLLGTFATAGALAVAAKVLLGLDWAVAGVLGAALAPTDPAVMFSVLGRREVGGRSGTVLEGEAGINDPAGIALLLGLVEVATHPGTSMLVVLQEFALAMGIGGALGLIGGKLLIEALGRLRLGDSGLYPVFALASAGLLYGVTSMAGGSGFSAVFVAGLLLGDARLPYAGEIDRFTVSLASLAEVAVFLALGLTIDIGGITGEDWLGGLLVFLVMAVLVRPLVVMLTLARSALSRPEKAFIAWSGLKGAVPILLAAFAVLGHVPDSQRIYDVVFVVVLASVVIQGGLVPTVAARLRIPMQLQPELPWELSVKLAEPPRDRVEITVEAGSSADGRRLEDLPLGNRAWVTLVVRDAHAVPPRPDLTLRAGDVLFLLGVDDEPLLADAFAGAC
ncbi:cation:proton antiporter [Paraconexibacter antarcticus]|uniref:Cation:proton antiporter n=1 Tax=Paraconexibacter antarcticus TaxID=2949664 RepID=A0ABY5DRR6_9ACTN|nr:cation:proton antiporter [Paraconexibacter antarcticus]UTI63390.1 cation:proton antiporter [Paraconexibacter antarcticus]